jgi:hypothetical protein
MMVRARGTTLAVLKTGEDKLEKNDGFCGAQVA